MIKNKFTLKFLKIIQIIVWTVGLIIVFCLFFYPQIGLTIFWDILIPVAPFLLVIASGIWRNICPLATTNLLPRHFNLSKRKIMSSLTQSKLQLISIVALYTLVPLRHVLFNTNGMATGFLLLGAAFIGLIMSSQYDWKSGWCASLCPIHPVEKLYGSNTILTLPNAHCTSCVNCSVPCPDATPNINPSIVKKNIFQKINAILTIGGLPGFIWGWFHVADTTQKISIDDIITTYRMPIIGFSLTVLLYILLNFLITKKNKINWLIEASFLRKYFAAASVSTYYWYRIPALIGFGKFKNDGILFDLKPYITNWSVIALTIFTTLFFFSWFLLRAPNKKSWLIRPSYAVK